MNSLINLINYFKTVKVIYQKKILNAIPFFKHSSYTKFLIISQPRVGSTLLLSLLNFHPHVIVKDEIVREKRSEQPQENILKYLSERVYARYYKTIKAVGFKYFYEHQEEEVELLEYLMYNKEVKIIHLKRKSLLSAHVSNLIAGNTGVWSNTVFQKEQALREKRVKIDKSKYRHYKQDIEKHYEILDDRFQDHAVFTLYYEDLVERSTQCLSEVQRFLNVKERHLVSLLKKQNPEDIKDLVINFEDIDRQ